MIHTFPLLSGMKRNLLLVIAGALTTLTLAPFFILPLLWLSFPLLLLHLRAAETRKRAFWDGWCFGFGYFTAGLYWFAYALLVDAALFGWLIPFAVFGISGILGIYTGLASLAAHRWRALPIVPYALVFALCWTVLDIIRSLALSGFPWNLLGYSMAGSETTVQLMSLGGVWWVTLLTYTLATLPLWWRQRKPFALAASLAVLALLWGIWRLETHQTAYHETIKLRLVQAAIPQSLKWQEDARYEALELHAELTLSEGYEDITHVIWPESAMTFSFEEGDRFARLLASLAPVEGSLITGVVRVEPPLYAHQPPHLFNSLKAITAEGAIDAVYDKRKLVPFGEYVPFRHYLPLMKITHGSIDFSTGTHDDALTSKGLPPFRPLICYEAIFPQLAEEAHPAWLLNITNDGWFGISTGPYQHFAMARSRAVEQGVPLVRPANSGVSAVIDPYGRVLDTLGLGERGVLDSQLPLSAPEPTLYAQLGHGVLLVTMLIYIGIIVIYRR